MTLFLGSILGFILSPSLGFILSSMTIGSKHSP